MLLEGAWLNWAFYFTSRNQPRNIGSSDFEEVTKDVVRLTRLTGADENRRKVKADNRGSCLPPFPSDIIYPDVHLRIYLECAEASGGIKDEHKGRWLLLQVSPWLVEELRHLFCTILGAERSFDLSSPPPYSKGEQLDQKPSRRRPHILCAR